MKIVAVLGSPRPEGNSATLAQKFLDEARSLGAETRSYSLNRMTFQGCQSCRACKTKSTTCILEDDLTEVLEAVTGADLLLLASPVYFGDLTGQLKCCVDRTYSFVDADFTSRLPAGKQAVMILVQANPDLFGFDDIFPRYQRFLKRFGFHPVHLLRAVGLREPEDLDQHPEFLAEAADLAREIVGAP